MQKKISKLRQFLNQHPLAKNKSLITILILLFLIPITILAVLTVTKFIPRASNLTSPVSPPYPCEKGVNSFSVTEKCKTDNNLYSKAIYKCYDGSQGELTSANCRLSSKFRKVAEKACQELSDPICLIPLSPAPTTSPSTNFGKAIEFLNENSNNNYILIKPKINLKNPFTLETWVKIPRPTSGKYLRNYDIISYLKDQALGDYGYIFKLSLEVQEQDGTARPNFSALINNFEVNNSNYISIYSNSTLQPNTWNHLAVTSYSKKNFCYLNLYVNGVLVKKSSKPTNNNQPCKIRVQNPKEMLIAKPTNEESELSKYFNGQLDEIRISNTVRLDNDFYQPFTPDKNTLALYHFDGNTTDVSQYHNDGQIIGNVKFITSTAGHNNFFPSPKLTTIIAPQPTNNPAPTAIPFPSASIKVYLYKESDRNLVRQLTSESLVGPETATVFYKKKADNQWQTVNISSSCNQPSEINITAGKTYDFKIKPKQGEKVIGSSIAFKGDSQCRFNPTVERRFCQSWEHCNRQFETSVTVNKKQTKILLFGLEK